MSKFKFISIFITLAILYTINVRAADIVRLQFDYADPAEYTPDPESTPEAPLPPLPRPIYTHYLDLELFADSAPLTVANYLDYVTSGSYDGTFINRSEPGFVLQTGGFTFRPAVPANDALRPIAEGTGLANVAVGHLSPVDNEFEPFKISNIRGTIAMAKVGGLPDSASNEWFINLGDNSGLDSQNGGFTVFGGVIDDGMTIADEISSFPIHQFIISLLGSAFSDMPVTGPLFGPIFQADMIMITSASVINRPILRFDTIAADFDIDIAGDAIDKVLSITLRNTGNEILDIGTINPANLSAPFSFVNDNCSNSSLTPQSVLSTSTCTIDFVFSPTVTGQFNDNVLIPYTSQATNNPFSVTYALSGEGVLSSPVLFSEVTEVNFPETLINTNIDTTITIRNKGGSNLTLTNFSITGNDAADFSLPTGGCTVGTVLAMGETCGINLRFLPSTDGAKTGLLSINSDAGQLDVNLSGIATKPVIAVPTSIHIFSQLNQTAFDFSQITNDGTANLILTDISISGPDAAFFTQTNNCPGTNNSEFADVVMVAGAQCGLLVEYTPTALGQHSATMTITSNATDTPSIDIPLTGQTDDPILSAPTTFFVGTAQVGGANTTVANLLITNDGLAPLVISSITGLSASQFSETNNCIGTNIQLPTDATCTISITFNAASTGNANATLSIISNDTITPTFNITIEAFGDNDTDGIISSIENNGPNAGDGNNDGVADDVQNNVATFITSNNSYITLISDNSLIQDQATLLRDISNAITSNENVSGKNVTFEFDTQSFTIELPAGDRTNVAVLLPVNTTPTGYSKFGPTSDNTTPHWYDFSFDPITQTGVTLIGNVSIASPIIGADPIKRFMIILSYADGLRGDDDLVSNGTITQGKGGVSFTVNSDNSASSGSLSLIIQLLTIISIMLLRARLFRVNN